jgi:hypothetical protein
VLACHLSGILQMNARTVLHQPLDAATRWIGRSVGRCQYMRYAANLTSSKGLLDPPNATSVSDMMNSWLVGYLIELRPPCGDLLALTQCR